MRKLIFLSILMLTFFYSCKETSVNNSLTKEIETEQGTADEKSEVIYKRMLSAMGGQENWQNLRYLSWTFFGNRKLIWDKHEDRVRIENPRDTSIYLTNLKTLKGRYFKNGIEVTEKDELDKRMQSAKNIWINDSYWLVMPFKLRDPGVTLKYLREDTILGGQAADVLELTFDSVGVTPENKYEVYVDKSDNLIKQWDFFKEASQEKSSRSWPWDNYKKYNNVMLSSDRSDKSGPSEVKVFETLEEKVFNEL